jgi:septal ring factor EnvC (AmiA/AmiB activator)
MSLEGDHLFQQRRLVEAEAAYKTYLGDQPAATRQTERALYHLGLIYCLPDSPLYDPDHAQKVLQRLISDHGQSPYALQASLILALQLQIDRLREDLTSQSDRAGRLLDLLSQLENEAVQAESQMDEQEDREQRLVVQIARLRREIGRLNVELVSREEELDQIKRIDLEAPP